MGYKKQQVESTLKRSISRVLSRRLSDPRVLGMVSVTRVDVSPDLHHALVYVSVLPDKFGPKSLHGLRHAVGRIHSLVRKDVAMRVVPRLEFRLDDSLKKQASVFDAIRRGLDQEGATSSLTDADGVTRDAFETSGLEDTST